MTQEKLTCEAVARAALGNPLREHGRELYWRCPQHDDRDPSLQVNTSKNVWMCGPCGKDGNWWQLGGFIAGINPDDKEALGKWFSEKVEGFRCQVSGVGGKTGVRGQVSGAGEGPKPETRNLKPVVIREHVYCEVDGTPIAKKLRWGSKDPKEDAALKRNKKVPRFTWKRYEGGKWVDGLTQDAQQALPPYRVDQLQAAAADELVLFTEGERDTDTALGLGYRATTVGGRTGVLTERQLSYLKDRDIVIVADADAPGRAGAQRFAATLFPVAKRVRVIEPPQGETTAAKDLTEAVEKGLPKEILEALIADAKDWRPATGADLLDEVEKFIRRFVSMEPNELACCAAWCAHTHMVKAFDYTPYLCVTSAEKQSGKTRLLRMLELFSASPMRTASISASALYRAVEKWQPTLLIDEADTAFHGDKETAEALRGVLNAGYERGQFAVRNKGQGAAMEPERYSTFGAKAIAGIGHIQDTITSRSLSIRMRRARRGDVERFRQRGAVKREADVLASKLAAWAVATVDTVMHNEPSIPQELDGREADMCEPLLAVADAAGGEWPKKLRAALVATCIAGREDENSWRTRLLGHIKLYYRPEAGPDALEIEEAKEWATGKELCEFLNANETWGYAELGKAKKPLTPIGLARALSEYKIAPRHKRIEGKTERGYEAAQFEDAWERYL